jgi:hypothetical protein
MNDERPSHVLQHSAVPSPRFSVGTAGTALLILADLIQGVAETW